MYPWDSSNSASLAKLIRVAFTSTGDATAVDLDSAGITTQPGPESVVLVSSDQWKVTAEGDDILNVIGEHAGVAKISRISFKSCWKFDEYIDWVTGWAPRLARRRCSSLRWFAFARSRWNSQSLCIAPLCLRARMFQHRLLRYWQ